MHLERSRVGDPVNRLSWAQILGHPSIHTRFVREPFKRIPVTKHFSIPRWDYRNPGKKPHNLDVLCSNSWPPESLNIIKPLLIYVTKYFFLICLFNWRLLYNIVLVLPYIDMNPPQVYTYSPSWTPLPPPPTYHPSGSSQCTSPEHPVSCNEPGLAIHFTYAIINVSVPFSKMTPPSPSPTESKRLFYTSVSLLLSRIQGYC